MTLPLTRIGEHVQTSRNMLILEINVIFNRKKFCFFHGVILHVSIEKYYAGLCGTCLLHIYTVFKLTNTYKLW